MWVTCETKQTPERYASCGSMVCFVLYVTQIFQEIINNVTSHNFFNIATFGIFSALQQLLLAPNHVVDPRVFYMKFTLLSRRTSTISQKNSRPPTLCLKQPVCKKLKFSENLTASDIGVQSDF